MNLNAMQLLGQQSYKSLKFLGIRDGKPAEKMPESD